MSSCPKCQSSQYVELQTKYNLGTYKINKYKCITCQHHFSKNDYIDFKNQQPEIDSNKPDLWWDNLPRNNSDRDKSNTDYWEDNPNERLKEEDNKRASDFIDDLN